MEYTVKDIEEVKSIPGNPQEKGGPAKVLKLTLEEDERQPELFTVASTPLPTIGEKYEGTIEESQYGPKFQRPRKGGGGGKKEYGWQTNPVDARRMSRAHSQEMALQREANLGAKWTGEQLRSVINWFDEDINTKDRAIEWDGLTSDIPGDTTDFDPKAA